MPETTVPDAQPPVPVAATGIDDLVQTLRELRGWAGEPSFAAIAKHVAELRLARGVPAAEATPGRVTVYDCFRDGRRRLDADLVLHIVAALGADREQQAMWRSAIRRVLMPGSGPVLAEVRVDPPAPEPFLGRGQERENIRMAAAEGSVAIDGMPGVGKSALALRAAQDIARELGVDGVPATVLVVNLRGFTAEQEPVEPDSAADALLRALGQDSPPAAPQRLGALRRELAQKPVVVVLDNAGSADQIAPLLPAAGSSARVLVTSRNRLEPSPGVARIHLAAMNDDEAVALLESAAGRELRVTPPREDSAAKAATDASVLALAQLAGGLPLALSLMGRRLAAHPDWPLADHVDAYRSRLHLLQLDHGVQAALEISYSALETSDQDLLRALSWHPAQSIGLAGATALTQGTAPEVEAALDRLSAASLVRRVVADRWEIHDLVRTFAAARSFDVDPPSTRATAVGRLGDDYLEQAAAAMAGLQPQAVRDWPWWDGAAWPSETATTWLDAERVSLLACAMWASQHRMPHLVTRLSAVLAHDLWRRGDVETTVELHRAALTAARELADDHDLGIAERNLGNTLVRAGRFTAARPHLTAALGHFADSGDEGGRLSTLSSLAIVASAIGDQDGAISTFGEIIELLRAESEPSERLAITLSNLAVTLTRAGRADEAIPLLQESVELGARHGWEERERVALGNLAGLLVEAGRLEEGLAAAERAVLLTEQVDDPWSMGYARSSLGHALHAVGRHDDADEQWQAALAIAREVDAPDLEASVLNHVADGHARLGEHDRARTAYEEALDLAEEIGEANEIERARTGLANLG